MAEYEWDERPVVDEIKDFKNDVFLPIVEEIMNTKRFKEVEDMQWVFIPTLLISNSDTFNGIYFMHADEKNRFSNRVVSRLKRAGAKKQKNGVLKILKYHLIKTYKKHSVKD